MASNRIDIHVAAGQGNLGEVKAFLKAGGIIDKRDADRWTPLMLAVREGHIEVAKQLLRSGAALEAKDGDKWTAMHVAAANGHPQCCQLLLDRGGNPRAVDENKRTPLHWATRYGYAAVVELLLKRGADPNSKDAEGKAAADVIGTDLSEDSREIVNALLREHAQKAKSNKQRRLSCPAIPRTAMITAVNASDGGMRIPSTVAAASPSSAASSEKSQTLLPLPSVMVATAVDNTASNGKDRPGESSQSARHNSFSAAAHIRDHPGTKTSQGAVCATTDETLPPKTGSSGLTLSKDLAAVAIEDAADSDNAGYRLAPKDKESHEVRSGDGEDDEVAALKKALRAAEERARASEKLLLESEERQAKEQLRATRLLERVAELEKVLLEQSGTSKV